MKPELLAPVGDLVSLRAAIDAGADAVYFGVELSMRTKNLTLEDMPELIKVCKRAKIKAYLAMNAVFFDDDLPEAYKLLELAKRLGIDAVICWDFAIISKAIELGIPIHLSTQSSIANSEALKQAKLLGAERVVLARECSIDMIKTLKKDSPIEIEAFCHGAMCVAVSGRCFMSQHLFGKSANRGECLQPCRREYLITEPEDDKQLVIGKDYVMSPKDLCTLPFIDQMMEIDCLKIEGRNRKPEYVKTITEVYREAIDLAEQGTLTDEKKQELVKKAKTVYNRGFSSGFYLATPGSGDFTHEYGSVATTKKAYVGKVVNFYAKLNVAEIKIESTPFKEGATLQVQGPTTGVRDLKVGSIEIDHKKVARAEKGETVALKTGFTCRKNDSFYLIS